MHVVTINYNFLAGLTFEFLDKKRFRCVYHSNYRGTCKRNAQQGERGMSRVTYNIISDPTLISE